MTELYEHNPEDHEDPVSGATWFVGFLGAVLLVVTLLGVAALYYKVKAEKVQAVVITPDQAEVKELRRQQEALLTGPTRWVERDDQGQTVDALVIPIERAMELIVQEANAENLPRTQAVGGTP